MILEQIKDCPVCDEPVFVVFNTPEGVDTADEIIDIEPSTWACPACGHVTESEYDGWTAHEDAG